ncbi:MAG: hypothetical protein LAQ69_31250 [Acidobacteriia bacterium]|nr:hypothetical protein [Terriglobia bacterium]
MAGSNGQFIYNNAGMASGSNLSQNGDGSLSAATGFNEKVCAVPFSATLSFNAANCNRFETGTLTANVSSSTITGLRAGQHLKFPLTQDNTGARTVTWPAGFVNMCQPWPGPNTITVQEADVMQDGVTVRGTDCTVDSAASSIGTGYLSESYAVGPTAIVANTWVKLTGGKLAPIAGTEGIYGIAPFACLANAASCEVAVAGQVQVTAEGSITQDHYLIHGTTNPARALDSAQTSQSLICSSARIGGRALASATDGQRVSIQLLSPGMQGAQICPADLPATTRVISCQPGWGDGLNAIPAGTYPLSECLNEFGATWTITAIKCYTDNNGASTLRVQNGASVDLLTIPVTCSNSWAVGTQSGTTTIAAGDFAKFSFVSDGASKQATYVITGTR